MQKNEAHTLEDLALQQQDTNPWLIPQPGEGQGASFASPGVPQAAGGNTTYAPQPSTPATDKYLQGLNSPAVNPNAVAGGMPNGPIAGGVNVPAATPTHNPLAVGTTDSKPDDSNGVTGGTETRATTGEPIITTGVGGGGGGYGDPYKKIEDEALDRKEGISKAQQDTLDKDDQSIQRQQQIHQVGIDTAKADLAKAESNAAVAQADEQTFRRKGYYDAQTQSRQDEREAEELRQKKIDPRHWYKQTGTLGSILAVIGTAMGAFGASLNRTPNYAGDMLNKFIERDIDSQKENLDNEWKAHADKTGLHKDNYAKFQWMDSQMNTLRFKEYDHTIALIDKNMLLTNDQAQLEGLSRLRNQVDREKLAITDKQGDLRTNVLLQQKQRQVSAQNAANAAAHSGDLTPAEMKNLFIRYQAGDLQGVPPGLDRAGFAKHMRSGKGLGTKEQQGTTGGSGDEKDVIQAAKEANSVLDQIDQIMADPTVANSPAGRAKLDTLLNAGALHYGLINSKSKRINDTEIKMGKEAFGEGGVGGLIRVDPFGRGKAARDVLRGINAKIIGGPSGGPSGIPQGATPAGQ